MHAADLRRIAHDRDACSAGDQRSPLQLIFTPANAPENGVGFDIHPAFCDSRQNKLALPEFRQGSGFQNANAPRARIARTSASAEALLRRLTASFVMRRKPETRTPAFEILLPVRGGRKRPALRQDDEQLRVRRKMMRAGNRSAWSSGTPTPTKSHPQKQKPRCDRSAVLLGASKKSRRVRASEGANRFKSFFRRHVRRRQTGRTPLRS